MSFKINNIILQQSEQQSLNIVDDNKNNNVLFFPESIVQTNPQNLSHIAPFIIKFNTYYNTYNQNTIGISECINGNFTNISDNTLNFYIKFKSYINPFDAIYTLNIFNGGIIDTYILGKMPNIYVSIILEKNSYFYFTVDRYVDIYDAENSFIFYRI